MGRIKKRNRISFLLDIFLAKKLSHPYLLKAERTTNKHLVIELHPQEKDAEVPKSQYNIRIYDLPNYWDTKILFNSELLKTLHAPLYSGFSIELQHYSGYDDYLATKLTSKRRSQLRGNLRRFEHCIQPTYKMYTGNELSETEVKPLLVELEKMIKVRFLEKREENYELPLMKYYRDVFFNLMQKERASLFVIYDDQKPINISMNFMLGDTLMPFNSAYDSNYKSFGIGHINMLKHIEWAFQKSFNRVDLGRGDYLHKRKWVDHEYTYQELIPLYTNSVLARIHSHTLQLILTVRYIFIKLLKKLRFHLLYGKLRRWWYRLRSPIDHPLQSRHIFRKIGFEDLPNSGVLQRIDVTDIEYQYYLHAYFDFLHEHRVQKTEIETFPMKNKQNGFYVKKGNAFYEIRLNQSS